MAGKTVRTEKRLTHPSSNAVILLDNDMLLMAAILTRSGRLNELFLASISRKVFGTIKHGFGEPWVLQALVLGGAPFRLSPTELCRRSLLTSGGMTKTLGRLEEAALITRTYDPNDRRALLVELTPKGKEWGQELLNQVASHYAEIFGPEGKAAYTVLRPILSKLEQLLGKPDTKDFF